MRKNIISKHLQIILYKIIITKSGLINKKCLCLNQKTENDEH